MLFPGATTLVFAALSLTIGDQAIAFEPAMSVTTDKSSRPIVFGTTNLPNGTQLGVLLVKQHGGYAGQSKATVVGGHFATEQFSNHGGPLSPGMYKVDVEMLVPELQSDEVQAVVGNHGQNMKGALVVKSIPGYTGSGYTVSYNFIFQLGSTVPAAAPAAPLAQGKSYDPLPAATSAPPIVHGPSFDCGKARSPSERLICADAELSALDNECADLYKKAKAAATDKAAFARQNRLEWQRRENTCFDKACLVDWYAQRRSQLSQVIANAEAAVSNAPTASTSATPVEAPASPASRVQRVLTLTCAPSHTNDCPWSGQKVTLDAGGVFNLDDGTIVALVERVRVPASDNSKCSQLQGAIMAAPWSEPRHAFELVCHDDTATIALRQYNFDVHGNLINIEDP